MHGMSQIDAGSRPRDQGLTQELHPEIRRGEARGGFPDIIDSGASRKRGRFACVVAVQWR
jgi:hypothetical protein